ncbi:MAG: Methyltransferase type 11 [Deltaproteobacteria bacterium]|nr:Methyltransferase type 11 [Deltaproteobacteria bacterium]
MNKRSHDHAYVPALSYDFLTPLYDPIVRLTTRDHTLKRRLLEQGGVRDDHRVLDIGCGTGTLLLLVRERVERATLIGLDGDLRILRIADSKSRKRPLPLAWVQAFSSQLPFASDAFDRVFSTLMLHHLSSDEKVATMREILRVLKPGGEVHIADWGRPHNLLMRVASLPLRLGHHGERATDNVQGRLPDLLRAAGFNDPQECARFATVFGTLSFYRASRDWR